MSSETQLDREEAVRRMAAIERAISFGDTVVFLQARLGVTLLALAETRPWQVRRRRRLHRQRRGLERLIAAGESVVHQT